MPRTKQRHVRSIRSLVAGTAVLGGSMIVAPQAHAAVIDTDGVYAAISGNAVAGSVNWRNYYNGYGQVTVYNDVSDGVCATAQQRVMRGGVWSGWGTLVILCTQSSYTLNVWTNQTSLPTRQDQERVRTAEPS